MFKAYKYRVYPNDQQANSLKQIFGAVRFIYNWGLERKNEQYQQDKKIVSYATLAVELTKKKQEEEFSWLNDTYSQSLQASLKNLDYAFTNFFKKRSDFPKFKSKHKSKASCQFPQGVKVDFDQYQVFIPKLKWMKFARDRHFEGKIKTCTVSMSKTGKFYISILVDDSKPEPKKLKINKNKALGIDLGLKNFATYSSGVKIANPKFLEKSQKMISKKQRELSRKQKGSKNREKSRYKLAKLYEKVTNRKGDFLHKTTYNLVNDSQVTTFCVENLNITGMMKNHKLARAIGSVSWYKFLQLLQYKAERRGKSVLQIGRFEASSKICTCGIKNSELTLKDREWTCQTCGAHHDRDILAANNIKIFALTKLKVDKLAAKDSVASINKACGAMDVSPSDEARTSGL